MCVCVCVCVIRKFTTPGLKQTSKIFSGPSNVPGMYSGVWCSSTSPKELQDVKVGKIDREASVSDDSPPVIKSFVDSKSSLSCGVWFIKLPGGKSLNLLRGND